MAEQTIQIRTRADDAGIRAILNSLGQLNTSLSNTNRAASSLGGGGFGNILKKAIEFDVARTAVEKFKDTLFGGLGAITAFNNTMETARMSFETFATKTSHSGLEAAGSIDKLFGTLQKLAIQTPFNFDATVRATQQMMAFGFSAQESLGILTRTQDRLAAAGNLGSAAIEDVTKALAKLGSGGVVHARELNQLVNNGIPAWEILSQRMGVTTGQLRDMVQKGMVPASTALTYLMDDFDKFQGAGKRASTTFIGAMRNIEDAVKINLGTAFGDFFKLLTVGANRLATFLGGDQVREFAVAFNNMTKGVVEPFLDLFKTGDTDKFWSAMKEAGQNALSVLLNLGSKVVDALPKIFEFLVNLGQNAFTWGYNLVTEYGSGMISAANDAIQGAVEFVGGFISEFLASFSPPHKGVLKDIDTWGANLITTYMMGMKAADYKTLDEIGKIIGDRLLVAFRRGDIPEEGIIRGVLGSEVYLTQMIALIRQTGGAGEEAQAKLDSLMQSFLDQLGPAADGMEQFVRAFFELQAAQERVDDTKKSVKDLENSVKSLADEYEPQIKELKRAEDAAKRRYDVELAKLDETMLALQRKMDLEDEANRDQLNQLTFAENQARLEDDKLKLTEAQNRASQDRAKILKDIAKTQREIADAQADAAKVLADPKSSPRQKREAQERISDLQATLASQQQDLDKKGKQTAEDVLNITRLQRNILQDQVKIKQQQNQADLDAAKDRQRDLNAERDIEVAKIKTVETAKQTAYQDELDKVQPILDAAKLRLDHEEKALQAVKDKVEPLKAQFALEKDISDQLEKQLSVYDSQIQQQEAAERAAEAAERKAEAAEKKAEAAAAKAAKDALKATPRPGTYGFAIDFDPIVADMNKRWHTSLQKQQTNFKKSFQNIFGGENLKEWFMDSIKNVKFDGAVIGAILGTLMFGPVFGGSIGAILGAAVAGGIEKSMPDAFKGIRVDAVALGGILGIPFGPVGVAAGAAISFGIQKFFQTQFGKDVENFLRPAGEAIQSGVKILAATDWSGVGTAVQGVLGGIRDIGDKAGTVLGEAGEKLGKIDWGKIGTDITTYLKPVVDDLLTAFNNTKDAVGGLVELLGKVVTSESIQNLLKVIAGLSLKALQEGASGLAEITGAISALIDYANSHQNVMDFISKWAATFVATWLLYTGVKAAVAGFLLIVDAVKAIAASNIVGMGAVTLALVALYEIVKNWEDIDPKVQAIIVGVGTALATWKALSFFDSMLGVSGGGTLAQMATKGGVIAAIAAVTIIAFEWSNIPDDVKRKMEAVAIGIAAIAISMKLIADPKITLAVLAIGGIAEVIMHWNDIPETVQQVMIGVAIGLAAVATSLLLFNATPIGALVTFVALLGVLAITHWGDIIDGLGRAADEMGKFFRFLGNLDLGDFGEGIKRVGQALFEGITWPFKKVYEWFTDNVLTPILRFFHEGFKIASPSKVMMEIGQALLDGLLAPFDALLDLIGKIFDPLVSFFEDHLGIPLGKVGEIIKTAIMIPLDFIHGYIITFFGLVGVIWQTGWDTIKLVLTTAWELLQAIVQHGVDTIKAIFNIFAGIFTGDWDRVWQGIKDLLDAQWELIKNVIKIGLNFIRGLVDIGLNAIKGIFESIWGGIKATLGGIWDQINDLTGGKLDDIKAVVQKGLNAVVDFIVGDDGIANKIKKGFMGAFEWLRDNIGPVINKIGSVISGPFNAIVGVIRGFVKAIKSGVNWVSDKLGLGKIFDDDPPIADVQFNAPSAGGGGNSNSGSQEQNFTPYALGGRDLPGGWKLVGELGPEIIYTGPGADIYTASDTRRMLPMLAGQDSLADIHKALARYGLPMTIDHMAAAPNTGGFPGVDFIRGAYEKASDAVRDFANEWIAKGASALVDKALEIGGAVVPPFPGAMKDFGKGIFDKVKTQIFDRVKELLGLGEKYIPKPAPQPLSADGADATGGGGMIPPLNSYTVTQEYGPASGANGYSFHTGIDLAGPYAAVVRAAADGTLSTGWDGGYGFRGLMGHGGGIGSLYGHMIQEAEYSNLARKQGELVGHEGSTGNSTGPHVHFEVREGGVAVNPRKYVRLAKGGMINHRVLFVDPRTGQTVGEAGEAGPEAVVPTAGSGTGGGSGPGQITIQTEHVIFPESTTSFFQEAFGHIIEAISGQFEKLGAALEETSRRASELFAKRESIELTTTAPITVTAPDSSPVEVTTTGTVDVSGSDTSAPATTPEAPPTPDASPTPEPPGITYSDDIGAWTTVDTEGNPQFWDATNGIWVPMDPPAPSSSPQPGEQPPPPTEGGDSRWEEALGLWVSTDEDGNLQLWDAAHAQWVPAVPPQAPINDQAENLEPPREAGEIRFEEALGLWTTTDENGKLQLWDAAHGQWVPADPPAPALNGDGSDGANPSFGEATWSEDLHLWTVRQGNRLFLWDAQHNQWVPAEGPGNAPGGSGNGSGNGAVPDGMRAASGSGSTAGSGSSSGLRHEYTQSYTLDDVRVEEKHNFNDWLGTTLNTVTHGDFTHTEIDPSLALLLFYGLTNGMPWSQVQDRLAEITASPPSEQQQQDLRSFALLQQNLSGPGGAPASGAMFGQYSPTDAELSNNGIALAVMSDQAFQGMLSKFSPQDQQRLIDARNAAIAANAPLTIGTSSSGPAPAPAPPGAGAPPPTPGIDTANVASGPLPQQLDAVAQLQANLQSFNEAAGNTAAIIRSLNDQLKDTNLTEEERAGLEAQLRAVQDVYNQEMQQAVEIGKQLETILGAEDVSPLEDLQVAVQASSDSLTGASDSLDQTAYSLDSVSTDLGDAGDAISGAVDPLAGSSDKQDEAADKQIEAANTMIDAANTMSDAADTSQEAADKAEEDARKERERRGGGAAGAAAGGTGSWQGGMALVGEHGPEVAYLPKGTGIFTNPVTRLMMKMFGGISRRLPAFASGLNDGGESVKQAEQNTPSRYEKSRVAAIIAGMLYSNMSRLAGMPIEEVIAQMGNSAIITADPALKAEFDKFGPDIYRFLAAAGLQSSAAHADLQRRYGQGIDTNSLSKHAKGGVITGPTLLMDVQSMRIRGIAGERGPEVIAPLNGQGGPQSASRISDQSTHVYVMGPSTRELDRMRTQQYHRNRLREMVVNHR